MEMYGIRWEQRFSNFKKALKKLEESVGFIKENFLDKEESILSELVKQGLIQGFEFTHELAWNVMKDYLTYQGNFEIKMCIRDRFLLEADRMVVTSSSALLFPATMMEKSPLASANLRALETMTSRLPPSVPPHNNTRSGSMASIASRSVSDISNEKVRMTFAPALDAAVRAAFAVSSGTRPSACLLYTSLLQRVIFGVGDIVGDAPTLVRGETPGDADFGE